MTDVAAIFLGVDNPSQGAARTRLVLLGLYLHGRHHFDRFRFQRILGRTLAVHHLDQKSGIIRRRRIERKGRISLLVEPPPLFEVSLFVMSAGKIRLEGIPPLIAATGHVQRGKQRRFHPGIDGLFCEVLDNGLQVHVALARIGKTGVRFVQHRQGPACSPTAFAPVRQPAPVEHNHPRSDLFCRRLLGQVGLRKVAVQRAVEVDTAVFNQLQNPIGKKGLAHRRGLKDRPVIHLFRFSGYPYAKRSFPDNAILADKDHGQTGHMPFFHQLGDLGLEQGN